MQELLFTSGLLGVTGIPESSWRMGGAEGKTVGVTDDSVIKVSFSISALLQLPSPPPPPGPWLLSLEDSGGTAGE